ncbi:MAG TPA: glycosyltransferase family 39 protein, partial [Acidimicrobiales bacterium]|nr:glycosyltransferase family 39 protein [Acidimicrobiales bacterium]
MASTATSLRIEPGESLRTGRFSTRAAVLGVLALALRLVLGRFEPLPPTRYLRGPLVADETWYVRVAHNLLEGRGFVFEGVQTALHGPLTVLLLVPATALQPFGYTAQRATMSVLGALAVVVIAYVGRELGGDRLGLVAGVVAALYPGLWVNDLVATSETPAIALLSVVLYLSLRCRRGLTWRRVVALGVTLGLLALDRGELAFLGAALCVPGVVVGSRGERRRGLVAGRSAAVIVVLALALIAPWAAYNQSRFHRTVLISDDLGQTLVGANCPQSYYGPLTGYDGNTCFFSVLAAEERAQPHANEAAQNAWFQHEAITYALHHASRWPEVAVLREAWLWSLWRPGWTVVMSAAYIGRPAWMSWLQIASFWVLAPVAFAGALLARRRRVRVGELVTMVVFTALLGLLVVGHLRYRIAAEVAIVTLSAIALDSLAGLRTPV